MRAASSTRLQHTPPAAPAHASTLLGHLRPAPALPSPQGAPAALPPVDGPRARAAHGPVRARAGRVRGGEARALALGGPRAARGGLRRAPSGRQRGGRHGDPSLRGLRSRPGRTTRKYTGRSTRHALWVGPKGKLTGYCVWLSHRTPVTLPGRWGEEVGCGAWCRCARRPDAGLFGLSRHSPLSGTPYSRAGVRMMDDRGGDAKTKRAREREIADRL